jgi:hypothetical protein
MKYLSFSQSKSSRLMQVKQTDLKQTPIVEVRAFLSKLGQAEL